VLAEGVLATIPTDPVALRVDALAIAYEAWQAIDDLRIDDAREGYRRARAVLEPLGTDRDATLERVQFDTELAHCERNDSHLDAAKRVLARAIAEAARLDPTDLQAQWRSANAHFELATTYGDEGDPAHAHDELEVALRIYPRLRDGDPANPDFVRDIAEAEELAGNESTELGDYTRAMRELANARTTTETLVAAAPTNPRHRTRLCSIWRKIGNVHFAEKRIDDALVAFAKSIAVEREAIAVDHVPNDRLNLQWSLERQGTALLAANRRAEAIATFQEARTVADALLAGDPNSAYWLGNLGGTEEELALAHDPVATDILAGALAHYRQAAARTEGFEKDITRSERELAGARETTAAPNH
jgi:tetratricopeptide (TPR) repeat protein